LCRWSSWMMMIVWKAPKFSRTCCLSTKKINIGSWQGSLCQKSHRHSDTILIDSKFNNEKS
jgi:hypothetical protein